MPSRSCSCSAIVVPRSIRAAVLERGNTRVQAGAHSNESCLRQIRLWAYRSPRFGQAARSVHGWRFAPACCAAQSGVEGVPPWQQERSARYEAAGHASAAPSFLPGTAPEAQRLCRRSTKGIVASNHAPRFGGDCGAPPRWPPSARRLTARQLGTKFKYRALPQPRPNPSVEARPNGKAPGPRGGEAYHPPRGPGALPSCPPHLER